MPLKLATRFKGEDTCAHRSGTRRPRHLCFQCRRPIGHRLKGAIYTHRFPGPDWTGRSSLRSRCTPVSTVCQWDVNNSSRISQNNAVILVDETSTARTHNAYDVAQVCRDASGVCFQVPQNSQIVSGVKAGLIRDGQPWMILERAVERASRSNHATRQSATVENLGHSSHNSVSGVSGVSLLQQPLFTKR